MLIDLRVWEIDNWGNTGTFFGEKEGSNSVFDQVIRQVCSLDISVLQVIFPPDCELQEEFEHCFAEASWATDSP